MSNPGSSSDSFGAKGTLDVDGRSYEIFRLDAVAGRASTSRPLPYSLKVLLENLLRTEDGANITADDIRALAGWDADAEPEQGDPVHAGPGDHAGLHRRAVRGRPRHMREAMAELGGDATKINPLAPAEMVIDHSVIADVFGTPEAFERNVEIEYERNKERYQFLRWGQGAFDDFKVVPPGTGIVHQVNIEHLARTVFTRETEDGTTWPTPTPASAPTRTPRWSTASACVGWGVGGIEAEAAMLGQPVSMLIPRVVGFKLSGELPEGATATDLVLTITEMLRKHGVVGKFVEFYGAGVSRAAAGQPRHHRQHVARSSARPSRSSRSTRRPSKYLELTGRSRRADRARRGLRQGAGPLARPERRAALLRAARARPGHRRAVARRPEAPAGPGLAQRRQGRRSAPAARRDYVDERKPVPGDADVG